MKIHTNIKVLKEILKIAEDTGIDIIFQGESGVKILEQNGYKDIITEFLANDGAIDLIRAITQDNLTNFEEMDLDQIIDDILTPFFAKLTVSFQKLVEIPENLNRFL